ncbi:MAG: Zinc-containing alcohol dehydrogenase superfamily protein [Parcubacteria group bacterium Gr01-1014_56]|nr:MAG: Zinc-containing alcohol dehydrogenase superfamily protein [Parcubacteria group bacterium Gr01-1014_56]
MKAAILEQINAPLTVGEVGLTDLKAGQVLVKILVSGICGSQLQEIAGNKGNAKFLPHLMGHEGCGIVEDIGEGITRVKKGDKVVMHWRKGEGLEADFPSYIFKGKTIKSGKVTTFSEYSIVSENRITSVPQDTPNELCALLGCSLSTALGTINNEARVKPGESVMIVGAGGLGVNLIKAAKIAGASPIISVDIHEHKREPTLALGADLYINAAVENIAEVLQKELNIKNVQSIVDTSGAKQSLEATIPLLTGGGRYILVGQPKPGETIELKNAYHLFDGEGKTIKATQGGGFLPSVDIPKYLKLYKSGALNIEGVITHHVTLDEINDAIDLVRKGLAGRILIDISS